MPRALTISELDSFREQLCSAATRLFAADGYAGVTLRKLAKEVGCSPMTPYRYFSSKDEILAAARTDSRARERAHSPAAVPE